MSSFYLISGHLSVDADFSSKCMGDPYCVELWHLCLEHKTLKSYYF